MKSNFIKAAFVAAFASIAGYGVYTSQQKVEMSDLAMANVEALANDESSVTCVYDKGDTCMVGSTPVKDYDEDDDDSWF